MDRERGRSALVVGLAVVAVLALIVGAAAFVLTRSSGDATTDPDRPGVDPADPAVAAADRFAAALTSGDLSTVEVANADLTGAQVAEQVQFTLGGLVAGGATGPEVAVSSVEPGRGSGEGTATARARFTWTFPGDREWSYETEWLVVDTAAAAEGSVPDGDGGWRVAFDATMLLPRQGQGVVRVVRVPATRGRILDTGGRSLTTGGGTVTVGIRKSRAADPEATAREAARLTGVDAEELVARLAAAGPDEFVEVATLERAAYDLIRSEIRPLPGTVFTEQPAETDLPAGYAAGVLGSVGPATEEMAAATEGRVVGDPIGTSGIQAAYDNVLGGVPGLRVERAPADGSAPATVLHEVPAVPGQDVTVTLDPAVQAAADAAAAAGPKPVAIVAVRVSTGEVLAVANGPSGFNRAFLNRYPPGSTFKVVTALAYLERGLTPDTVVPCPASIVAGKRFKNAGDFALGDVPFRQAFARSCNTTIVGRADTITSQELVDTAALLGFRDLDGELGLDIFGRPVPVTDDETEHAADTIGQGKVEASGLTVALMAGSIANGTSLSPRLIADPVADPEAGAAPRPALPAGPVAALRDMMRAVVTDGTGSALASVPGGPVHAKTGTAEYGTESPPRSHAWIAGWQGDVAFAVVVEDGGGGGSVAGPVAADFLTRLAGG